MLCSFPKGTNKGRRYLNKRSQHYGNFNRFDLTSMTLESVRATSKHQALWLVARRPPPEPMARGRTTP